MGTERGGPILLVEDTAGMRWAISKALREAGYEVVEAENGKDALAKIEGAPGRWSKVLTDFEMPVMNGGELVRRARGLIPNIQIIVISGLSEEHDSLCGLREFQPIAFLSKPFQKAELLALLHKNKRKD